MWLPAACTCAEEYGHVVTLFFEERAKRFIREVLMPLLHMDRFYAVFEFADGRGQIHIHLLGWLRGGQPHALMHRPPPDGIEQGGAAARAAWDRAIRERKAMGPMVATAEEMGAPLEERLGRAPAALVTEGTGPQAVEDRVAVWKAAVLERWMREHNFRAHRPAGDDRTQWLPPEGTALPPETSPCSVFVAERL